MVDLGPVMDTADLELLQNLIRKHADLTGSTRATWILDNWSSMVAKFVKVFPHEYKRVLGIPRQNAEVKPLPPASTPERRQAVHGD